ncbi:MAG: CRISPR-associated endoribonuclease Cas6 [bacterium]
MRLVLTLHTDTTTIILREYIRNFIYDTIRTSKWNFYHDKPKYKHINYSNLFPFDKSGNLGSEFTLIISSPYDDLILHIEKNIGTEISLGNNKIQVLKRKILPNLTKIQKVQTATPMIARLPIHLYEKYRIDSKKESTFWTEKEVFNAFVDLVQQNTLRKFEDFKQESKMLGYRFKLENYELPLNIFSYYKYKKTVYGWDKHFKGTMWEFGINEEYQSSDIVKFLYNDGIGERNISSGSGFLNIVS